MQNDLLTYYEKMFSEYPDVVNVKTMCKMLGGISTKTGYRLLKDNKIKSFKIGRAFYITKFHILSYLLSYQNSIFKPIQIKDSN